MEAILQPDSSSNPATQQQQQQQQQQQHAYEGGMDSARQHVRFQFDRLDDWKRQEILQKQKRQAEMRDLLEEQVRAKQEREREDRARHQREDEEHRATPRGRNAFPIVASLGPGSNSANTTNNNNNNNQLEPEVSLASSRGTIAGNTPHDMDLGADEAFSRKFQWKQDAILEKQRKQRALRQSLEEQVRLKEERSLAASGSSSSATTSEISARTKPEAHTPRSSSRPMLPSAAYEDAVDPSGKLFTWKQEAILAKRREQEKTRRLLEEQIEEKRRAKKAAEAARETQGERERNGSLSSRSEAHHTSRGNARASPSASPSLRRRRRDRETSGEETPTQNQTVASVSGNIDTVGIDDELEALRQQVEQQKQLLREQSELMQEMQRQTGPASGKASAARAPKPALKGVAKEPKAGTKTKEAQHTRPVRERKPRRPSAALAAKEKVVRECTLRRNTAGRFCIEVEPVLDAFCLVKRIGKTHVQDKRSVLRPGDLIIALGAFAIRQTHKRLASIQEESLDTIMTSLDLPTFDEVTSILAKGGNLVSFAVCAADKDKVLAIAETLLQEEEEDEDAQRRHDEDGAGYPDTNEQGILRGSEERDYIVHQHGADGDHDPFAAYDVDGGDGNDANIWDNGEELHASSTFVQSEEWGTFHLDDHA